MIDEYKKVIELFKLEPIDTLGNYIVSHLDGKHINIRVNSNGYREFSANGCVWLEHRVIYMLAKGEILPNLTIDHINRCKTDNNINNLRTADWATQSRNRGIYNNGVSWRKRLNKFAVRLTVYTERVYIGYYTEKEDAINALDDATYLMSKGYSKSELLEYFNSVPKNAEQQCGELYVTWDKSKKKWSVNVWVKGKSHKFSSYETVEEAIKVRDFVVKSLNNKLSPNEIKKRLNLKVAKTPSSKYKGICFSKGRWIARMSIKGGVRVNIGSYKTEEEAFLALQEAVKIFNS